MWKRLTFCGSGSTLKKEAEANTEPFDFLRSRKRKHFEERSWKRLTLYGAGSGSKNYSTASTSLVQTNRQLPYLGCMRAGS